MLAITDIPTATTATVLKKFLIALPLSIGANANRAASVIPLSLSTILAYPLDDPANAQGCARMACAALLRFSGATDLSLCS
jgi:hypothetical protein